VVAQDLLDKLTDNSRDVPDFKNLAHLSTTKPVLKIFEFSVNL